MKNLWKKFVQWLYRVTFKHERPIAKVGDVRMRNGVKEMLIKWEFNGATGEMNEIWENEQTYKERNTCKQPWWKNDGGPPAPVGTNGKEESKETDNLQIH